MTVNPENELTETSILGESALKIEDTHTMSPFLMQLITSGDVWAYIGSNQAITAGRINPDHPLFPYYTQDKLFDMRSKAGGITVLKTQDKTWIPFCADLKPDPQIRQSISKSFSGTKIRLEEYHEGLDLSYQVTWTSSDTLGIVRHVEIINHSAKECEIELLDGIQNIMTPGVDQQMQNTFSILADAYKKSEWIEPKSAVFALSSVITDKAEPNECLDATMVWSSGLEISQHYLSQEAIEYFIAGRNRTNEAIIKGRRGCYLVTSTFSIAADSTKSWWLCADVDQSGAQITQRLKFIETSEDLDAAIHEQVNASTEKLISMVSNTDGRQLSNRKRYEWRHFSNSLFNIMRGGTFPTGYEIPSGDFRKHLKNRNKSVYEANKDWVESLEASIPLDQLLSQIQAKDDRDLLRISTEYLPLSFSRRHGDPSRPWNRFSIEVTDEAGKEKFAYQGNWRDIFQNWEALLHSFPKYSNAVIARFLNTTTFDGYNPYRITQDGFDWERLEPDSPWSNIGYWGDHQIVYLLKLLEFAEKSQPSLLHEALDERLYGYAAVPYRIKNLDAIVANARDSIEYDDAWSDRIDEQTAKIGADGQLVTYSDGSIVYGTLLEKLLVPLLAKMSNFVPGGGIWMNTQRPEWNDANTALAGYGASVVTMGYMLRYTRFLIEMLGHMDEGSVYHLHANINELLTGLNACLSAIEPTHGDSAEGRNEIVMALGKAGSDFRERFYTQGVDPKQAEIPLEAIKEALRTFEQHLEHSLKQNKRKDGLFHAYNLLRFEAKKALQIEYLPLMLEGQVSIISSGLLDHEATIELLDALEQSDLYRADQSSYMLYPDRELPSLLEKGVVEAEIAQKSQILTEEIERGHGQLVEQAIDGKIRFNARFRNANCLQTWLADTEYSAEQKAEILDVYEATFNHHAFTGRSRSFFAYEGLGSIYWHMVSKLALAVEEVIFATENSGQDLSRLITHFRKIQKGIGVDKSPKLYGAFPTDAYSHTPAHAGVQQPGMTGQVKEDVLIRLFELGVRIEGGSLSFSPTLIDDEEFLKTPSVFEYIDAAGEQKTLQLEAGSLAFTLCATPVVVRKSLEAAPGVRLQSSDAEVSRSDTNLSKDETQAIFARNHHIRKIEVTFA